MNTHFDIRDRTTGVSIGIVTAVDSDAAIATIGRDGGEVDAYEYPLSAEQQVWVDDHKDEAFEDDETYPTGMATLWAHRNGSLYFAEEGWDANGSATYLALVNLADGEAE